MSRLVPLLEFNQDCGVTVLQTGLHLPGARIVYWAGDGASARDALAVDEMADCSSAIAHGYFHSIVF